MRQVGDTLVWMALLVVVAAVLYFTPRVASFVSAREKDAIDRRAGVILRHTADLAEPASEAVQ
jgi:hypothetical protein